MEHPQTTLANLQAWCREVGELQLSYFRTAHLEVTTKSNPHDLVTMVDKESEHCLIEHIRRTYPGSAILAEESGSHSGSSEHLWVIDPLDGTNNFAAGLPVFAISIALERQGRAEVGVVYAPYLREMYWAVRGGGAYLNGARLNVSAKVHLEECILGTGFPYDKASHPVNNIDHLAHLLPQVRGIRRMGAAAYDLCAVAAGFLDGYWELNLSPWDVAAGQLIVEEAGGSIVPFRNDRKISIIAANPRLGEEIQRQLARVSF